MQYTVTQRVRAVYQPEGGYLPIKAFNIKNYQDNKILNPRENIRANYIGLAVDYLTRYKITKNIEEAFDISLLGAKILYQQYGRYKDYQNCLRLLDRIKQGDTSAAVQIVAYDEVYRAGVTNIPRLVPDKVTINNIEIMVQRGVDFLHHCSSIIKTGINLEGSYTDIVVNGDIDYLTDNALIDFKVIRGDFTADHSLQILMYYLMGLRSFHSEDFQKVKWLALFNPRKNNVCFIHIKDISKSVIDEVSTRVIGY